MLGEISRVGRLGAMVCFRLEGSMELLWKAPLEFLPQPNWHVGLLVDGEVETWYKVEQVKCEFQVEIGEVGGDPPQPWEAEYAAVGPCIIVSEV